MNLMKDYYTVVKLSIVSSRFIYNNRISKEMNNSHIIASSIISNQSIGCAYKRVNKRK